MIKTKKIHRNRTHTYTYKCEFVRNENITLNEKMNFIYLF